MENCNNVIVLITDSPFHKFPRNSMWRHMLDKMVANVYISVATFRKVWRHIEFLEIYEKGNIVATFTATRAKSISLKRPLIGWKWWWRHCSNNKSVDECQNKVFSYIFWPYAFNFVGVLTLCEGIYKHTSWKSPPSTVTFLRDLSFSF